MTRGRIAPTTVGSIRSTALVESRSLRSRRWRTAVDLRHLGWDERVTAPSDIATDAQIGRAAAAFRAPAAVAQRAVASALFGTGAMPRLAGRYRLGPRLGAGAQGQVWRAHDEHLDRDVAIKIHHIEGARDVEQAEAWLKREARMLGRIAHPHVVAVFDVGLHTAAAFGIDDEGPVVFVVLELIEGVSLADWLGERWRTPDEIAEVFRAVGGGLQAVHDAGLVHCDLKPGNILVTAHGIAKLADFGLAHVQRGLRLRARSADIDDLLDVDRTTEGGSTLAGPFGGTPLYMPPEQFERGRIDARADQYALAATWYEALVRRPAHRGGDGIGLLAAKLAGPPPRPRTGHGAVAITRTRYRALARALAVDPARRFASVTEFVQAMTSARRSRRWPWLAGVAALGIAGLALARPRPTRGCEPARLGTDPTAEALAAIDVGDDSPFARELARRVIEAANLGRSARQFARQTACAVETVERTQLDCLDALDRLAEAALQPGQLRGRMALARMLSMVQQLPGPDACLSAPQSVLGATPYDPAALEREIAANDVALRDAVDAQARGDAELALVALDRIDLDGPAGRGFRGEARVWKGQQLLELERYDEATALEQSVWEEALWTDAPFDAMRAASALAHIEGVVRLHRDEGLEWVRHARSQLARIGDLPAFAAELDAVAGSIHGIHGEFAAGIAEIEQGIARLEAAGDDEPARMAMTENAALLQMQSGLVEPAEERIRSVLAWREGRLGPDHTDVARSLLHLAFIERLRGHPSEALDLLDRAMAIQLAAAAPLEAEIAAIESARAEIALEQGRFDDALRSIAAAGEIRSRILPPDHPDRAAAILMQLEVLIRADRFAEADAVTRRNRDEIAVLLGGRGNSVLALEEMLARVDGLNGRLAASLTRLTHLVDEAERRRLRLDAIAGWCISAASLAGQLGDLAAAATWVDRADAAFRAHGGRESIPRDVEILRHLIAGEDVYVAKPSGE